MSFKDDLTRVNTIYCNSLSPSELAGALSKLDELLDSGLLNRENAENAEALYCRLYIKARLLEYAEAFDSGKSAEIEAYIGGNYEGAKSKGYKKTCAVMDGARRVLKVADEISADVSALSKDNFKSAAVALGRLKERVEGADIVSPFGAGVEFVDIKGGLLSRIESAISRAEKSYIAELEKKTARYLRAVSDKYKLYEYFPMPEYDEGGAANTVIICTPFSEEARLYAVRAAEGKTIYELDASAFSGQSESDIGDAFAVAERKCGALVVFNSEKLDKTRKNELYKCAMLSGRRGLKIFIHDDNGDGAEYDGCLKIAAASEDMRAVDISTAFVTMPAFCDVCAEFEAKGMISGAAEYDEIKRMPFMGFTGLNKVVAEFVAGADWKKTGRRLSAEREEAAKKYLSYLKSAYLFIDSGWGDYVSGGAPEVTGGFDYDGVRGVDLENVRRIVESGHSVFAQCGMIARYCTLAGGDKSDWEKLDRAEMEERLALATRLVFKVMRVETVPEVELMDKLDNPTAGGLCCDGGKRILYLYSTVRANLEWTLGCIVHESYHALQAKLRKGGWSQWYFDNFGITRGRVERWVATNNIYDGNTNSNVYKVHIIEADAKAFETDCDDGRNFAWNTIDFVG